MTLTETTSYDRSILEPEVGAGAGSGAGKSFTAQSAKTAKGGLIDS